MWQYQRSKYTSSSRSSRWVSYRHWQGSLLTTFGSLLGTASVSVLYLGFSLSQSLLLLLGILLTILISTGLLLAWRLH